LSSLYGLKRGGRKGVTNEIDAWNHGLREFVQLILSIRRFREIEGLILTCWRFNPFQTLLNTEHILMESPLSLCYSDKEDGRVTPHSKNISFGKYEI